MLNIISMNWLRKNLLVVGLVVLVLVLIIFVLKLINTSSDKSVQEKERPTAFSDLREFYAPYLGFSFFHSKSYEVLQSADDSEMISVLLPGESPEGVVVIARERDPNISLMDWLRSEYSGYDFSNGYEEGKIGGEDALLLHWHNSARIDGALFLNPDGDRMISVVIFDLDDPNKDLDVEFNKIIDTFSFTTAVRCPEDYGNAQERSDSVDNFIMNAQKRYPGVTAEELAGMRYDFLVMNRCQQTF